MSAPCRIDYAVGSAAAGDEVIVEPGNYAYAYPVLSSAPITVHGAAGQPVPKLISNVPTSSPPAALDLSGGGQVSGLYIEAQGTGQDALSMYGGTADRLTLVSGAGDAISMETAPGATVLRDSVVRSTSGSAVHVQDGQPSAGTAELRNDTIIGGGLASGIEAQALGLTTARNVIVRAGTDIDVSAPGARVTIDHSNFRPGSSVGPGLTDNGANQATTPVFVNRAANDFHEQAGAPTIDAGTSDALNSSLDLDGNPRTLGLAPDIGAYEFQPPIGSTGPSGPPVPPVPPVPPLPPVPPVAPGTPGTPVAPSGPAGAGSVAAPVADSQPVLPPGYALGTVAPLDSSPPALPAPTRPVAGVSITVAPVRGAIAVLQPQDGGITIPLTAAAQVPVDSIIDARHGAVTLTTARDRKHGVQSATFRGGAFRVYQADGAHPYTDIYLVGGDFKGCSRVRRGVPSGSGAVAARRHGAGRRNHVVRGLWAQDHHGRYRTHGKNSVATVRGTTWYTEDRCDGTLTRVTHGRISVRDLHGHRQATLTAHRSHLAPTR